MKADSHPHPHSRSGPGVLLVVIAALAVAGLLGFLLLVGVGLFFVGARRASVAVESQRAVEVAQRQTMEEYMQIEAEALNEGEEYDEIASRGETVGSSPPAEVALPTLTGVPGVTKMFRVTINADGKIELDGEAVEQDSLSQELVEKFAGVGKVKVVIAADADVKYSRVVELFEVCQQLGAEVLLQSLPSADAQEDE